MLKEKTSHFLKVKDIKIYKISLWKVSHAGIYQKQNLLRISHSAIIWLQFLHEMGLWSKTMTEDFYKTIWNEILREQKGEVLQGLEITQWTKRSFVAILHKHW